MKQNFWLKTKDQNFTVYNTSEKCSVLQTSFNYPNVIGFGRSELLTFCQGHVLLEAFKFLPVGNSVTPPLCVLSRSWHVVLHGVFHMCEIVLFHSLAFYCLMQTLISCLPFWSVVLSIKNPKISSTSLISDSCWYFMLWNFAAFFFSCISPFYALVTKIFWVVAKHLAKPERWHFCLSESWFIFFEKISLFFKSPVVFSTTKNYKKLENLLGRWFYCLLCCSMTPHSVYLC